MGFIRNEKSGYGEMYKFETKGQTLTAYYMGSQDIDGAYGPSKKHIFRTPEGVVKTVFGQTHLGNQLTDPTSEIRPGMLVRITYDGTQKTKGGNMKVYLVDYDPSQTQEAGEVAAAEAGWSQTEEDTTEDDQALDQQVTGPVKLAPGAAPVSDATKAKVNALLGGRRAA